MKYINIIILFLISTIVNGQCKKDTSVQYYDSTYQSFSQSRNVTVEFGKGTEISNNYNYIDYESDALYCVVYGFDKKYEVKLYSNYSSIYKTSCSSISNVFTNGFVKGKDQDGRIWKIKKPSSQNYSNNDNYNNGNSVYNKPKSRINHKKIGEILSSKQAKIDYNRERVVNKMDETIHQLKILENKIELIGNPEKLLNQISEVKKNLKSCVNNADEYFASSNKSTLYILSCLNGQKTNLEIIENNTNNYTLRSNNKEFNKKPDRIYLDKSHSVDYKITNSHLVLSIKGNNSVTVKIDVNNNNKIDSNFDRYYGVTSDKNICAGYLISKSTTSTCGKAKSNAIVKNYSDSRSYEIPISEISNTTIGLTFSYFDGQKHNTFPNDDDFNKTYKIKIY